MNWQQIRELHPNSWVVLEAITAHAEQGQYLIENMSVHGVFGDEWERAWKHYKDLREADKTRDYLVIHTRREQMNIGILDAFGRQVE